MFHVFGSPAYIVRTPAEVAMLFCVLVKLLLVMIPVTLGGVGKGFGKVITGGAQI
jgi:hypothetical protein